MKGQSHAGWVVFFVVLALFVWVSVGLVWWLA